VQPSKFSIAFTVSLIFLFLAAVNKAVLAAPFYFALYVSLFSLPLICSALAFSEQVEKAALDAADAPNISFSPLMS